MDDNQRTHRHIQELADAITTIREKNRVLLERLVTSAEANRTLIAISRDRIERSKDMLQTSDKTRGQQDLDN